MSKKNTDINTLHPLFMPDATRELHNRVLSQIATDGTHKSFECVAEWRSNGVDDYFYRQVIFHLFEMEQELLAAGENLCAWQHGYKPNE